MNTITDKFVSKTQLEKYGRYYINEVLEAFVAILLYNMISKGSVSNLKDFVRFAKAALAVGLFTTVLENYNSAYKEKIKSGVISTLGTNIVKSA